MNNDVLTIKEVAKLLGVSTNTVYKYVNAGALASTRPLKNSGRFKITKKSLEEFSGISYEELVGSIHQHKDESDKNSTVKTEVPISLSAELDDSSYDALKRIVHSESHQTQPHHAESASPSTPPSAKHQNSGISSPSPDQKHTKHEDSTQHASSYSYATPPSTLPAHAFSYTLPTARILLFVSLALFTFALATTPTISPLSVVLQLTLFFVMMMLAYQYGGIKRKKPEYTQA